MLLNINGRQARGVAYDIAAPDNVGCSIECGEPEAAIFVASWQGRRAGISDGARKLDSGNWVAADGRIGSHGEIGGSPEYWRIRDPNGPRLSGKPESFRAAHGGEREAVKGPSAQRTAEDTSAERCHAPSFGEYNLVRRRRNAPRWRKLDSCRFRHKERRTFHEDKI